MAKILENLELALDSPWGRFDSFNESDITILNPETISLPKLKRVILRNMVLNTEALLSFLGNHKFTSESVYLDTVLIEQNHHSHS